MYRHQLIWMSRDTFGIYLLNYTTLPGLLPIYVVRTYLRRWLRQYASQSLLRCSYHLVDIIENCTICLPCFECILSQFSLLKAISSKSQSLIVFCAIFFSCSSAAVCRVVWISSAVNKYWFRSPARPVFLLQFFCHILKSHFETNELARVARQNRVQFNFRGCYFKRVILFNQTSGFSQYFSSSRVKFTRHNCHFTGNWDDDAIVQKWFWMRALADLCGVCEFAACLLSSLTDVFMPDEARFLWTGVWFLFKKRKKRKAYGLPYVLNFSWKTELQHFIDV